MTNTSQRLPSYASVVLDVDSTLTSLEGIEWLAARRGPETMQAVATMTDRAMQGLVPLDAVYGERLALVRPTRTDVAALADAYVEAVVPDAALVVGRLRDAGVRLVMVSGGVREALLPLAASLGIPEADVHGVSLQFTDHGEYAGFDVSSPLSRRGGKPALVRTLGLPRRVLAIGDGSTDAELKTDPEKAVDTFVAFTGVARRAPVVAAADAVVARFSELLPLILGTTQERV